MNIFNILDEFLKSCSDGNLEQVKILFPYIEDVNFTHSGIRYNPLKHYEKNNYLTPLFIATNQFKKESYKIIEFLLEKGANPNFRCNVTDGYLSPLHNIIYASFESMSFRMNMDYEELSIVDDEMKLEITGLKLLIEYGAEINIKDAKGKTPLDWSIRFEHKPAEKYLRSLGAKKGSEISDEENLLLEKKLSESIKEINHHFVSWYEDPSYGKETGEFFDDIPSF